jgi:tRNA 2-thiouridine synthesizing protein A
VQDVTLIAIGLKCPRPLFEVHRAMQKLPSDATLVVHADDPAFPPDIQAWCRRTGNVLVDLAREADRFTARIRKPARDA